MESRFTPELLEKLAKIKEYLGSNKEEREHLGHCPACGSNIRDREVSLYRGLIETLYRVYSYLEKLGVHEFNMKEVKHMMSKNDYSRFNNLVRFGGVIYRPKHPDTGEPMRGYYGMNMERAAAFFRGDYKISIRITLNQITDEIENAEYVDIHNFPELVSLLDHHGIYRAY